MALVLDLVHVALFIAAILACSVNNTHTQLYFTKLAAKHRKHGKQTVTHNKNQNKLNKVVHDMRPV